MARRAETILAADDEPAILGVLRRSLEKAGYVVIAAGSGTEAVQLGHSHAGPIDLIVTDVTMPGLTGPEVVKDLRKRWPKARALYLSGYSDSAVFNDEVMEAGSRFLEKPFTLDALLRSVREALDTPLD